MSSKISHVEFHVLRTEAETRPHWVSLFKVPNANELLVRLRTDDGVEGFGLATSYTDIAPITKVVADGFADLILGMDALAPEALYEKLFALTSSRQAAERGWGREALIRISAAVDLACWDIRQNRRSTLYRLFGGYRNQVPCYVTCAYYRDGKDNAECGRSKCLWPRPPRLQGQGRRFEPAEDIARMEIVREVIGLTAIDDRRQPRLGLKPRRGRLLAPPAGVAGRAGALDRRSAELNCSQSTAIPLSGGESEITSYGCGRCSRNRRCKSCNSTAPCSAASPRAANWRPLRAHVDVAPHHDCFIHAPLVAASPAGRIVESFTDPERDPLQAELYENPPHIADGWLTLNEAPGLGLTLSAEALAKFARPVASARL